MKKSEPFSPVAAPGQARKKQQTSSVFCIAGGILALWLYVVLAQLGEPAASALQPSGAFAVSKHFTLLPVAPIGFAVTSFRQQLLIFLIGIALQLLILALVIWRLARHHAQFDISNARQQRRLVGVIFAFAVLFRLALLPQTPWLSDDIYRYLWDGRMLANGINPFRYAPAAAELSHLRDAEIFPRINHKDVVTVYPPFLQALFWLANRLGGSVMAMKALFIAADLGLVLLLFWALPKLGSPPWWAMLYAWHPLAMIEIAGSGHADGIGALFLFAAVALLALQRKKIVAVVCLALAFLVKFLSVLLLPFLFLRQQTQSASWRGLFNKPNLKLLFLFFFFIFFSYLFFSGGHLLSGLTVYAAKWRFNDSIFALFYELIHALLPNALVTKLMIPAHWEITDEVLATRRVDLALLATKILMAGILMSFIFMQLLNAVRRPNRKPNCSLPFAVCSLPSSALAILGLFFLLSPTVQPWYLLWLLPLLCVVRQPGWIAWSATIFLAYWILDGYARSGVWEESAWVKWLEYGAAGMVAVAARVWKRQKNKANFT